MNATTDRTEIDKLIDKLQRCADGDVLDRDDAERISVLLGQSYADSVACDGLRHAIDVTTGLRHSDDAGRVASLKDPERNKSFFSWATNDTINDLNREIARLRKVNTDYSHQAGALTEAINQLRSHPIACKQVGPDGVVPGDTVEALVLWHDEAQRLSIRLGRAVDVIKAIGASVASSLTVFVADGETSSHSFSGNGPYFERCGQTNAQHLPF